MKSEKDSKDLPVSWKLGTDILTTRLTETNPGNATMVLENSNAMKGGTQFTFRGKVVPCFVCASPTSSITSQLLADMLAPMDDLRFGSEWTIV
jgi:hypothetical protein